MRSRRQGLAIAGLWLLGACAGTAEVPPEYPPLEAPPRESPASASSAPEAGKADAAASAPSQPPAPQNGQPAPAR